MAHSHGPRTGRVLIGSLALTVAFVIGEAIAGLRSHSLALVSDAGHNVTDAIGLVLAGAGYFFQSRPGNQIKTFGYHRTGVLAAFVNALILACLSLALFYESIQRFRHPQPVTESVMIWVAAIGLVVNLAIAWSLDSDRADLNLRAAWVHMLGDAVSCLGIIVGGALMYLTGWLAIDPILSILIAAAIVWTAWDIFRDSINILLEGLPKGLKLSEVMRAIRQVTGVIDVHDLHVWSLGSETHALSCHVLIEDMPPSESDSILRNLNGVLGSRFHIHHTTIQFEHARCVLADASCTVGKHAH
ncbi:MAG TPA: cation diffusion facilitator family transporter [Bryobacteraceae bacterium]